MRFQLFYQGSVVVNLVDNDEIPTISILTQAESVFEGGKNCCSNFNIKSHPVLELRVQLTTQTPTQQVPILHEVTLAAYANSTLFIIDTDYNDQLTGDYQLIVQLESGQNYQVRPELTNQATITVKDLETLPEITITTQDTRVNEGEMLEIVLESTQRTLVNKIINLSIATNAGNDEILIETTSVVLNAGGNLNHL